LRSSEPGRTVFGAGSVPGHHQACLLSMSREMKRGRQGCYRSYREKWCDIVWEKYIKQITCSDGRHLVPGPAAWSRVFASSTASGNIAAATYVSTAARGSWTARNGASGDAADQTEIPVGHGWVMSRFLHVVPVGTVEKSHLLMCEEGDAQRVGVPPNPDASLYKDTVGSKRRMILLSLNKWPLVPKTSPFGEGDLDLSFK